MSEARVLACAQCGAPTGFLAGSCAYCGATLTWHDVPVLRRGPLVRRFDLARGELLLRMGDVPGVEVRRGEGVIVPVAQWRSTFFACGLQLADCAVRMEAAALDPGVGFGVDLRVTTPGAARTSYAVKVLPWLRAFRLERVLSTPVKAFAETLRAPESVPQLGGVGETIELEARCADSVLSIHVGDLHLGSFVDARYGFGAMGLTADGYHGAGRVLIRSFAVHEVR
jgi:hypothetical protein